MSRLKRKATDAKTINRIRYRICMIANSMELDSILIYTSHEGMYVRVRHCIVYILTDIFKISYWSVANVMYKKSHQTIIKASEKYRYDLEVNQLYKSIFKKCMKYLGDIYE